MLQKQTILKVANLKKYFFVGYSLLRKPDIVKAVDNISFTMQTGETLGLVGESGCGKTTVGRTIIGLYEPSDGNVYFEGNDICTTSDKLKCENRRQMQMIFQDPYASLNPRMTVGDIVGEPIDIHKLVKGKKERQERIQYLLELVGLNPEHINRYPHEFSGGQRQRVGIARALEIGRASCRERVYI